MAKIRKRSWKTATEIKKTAWVVDFTDNRGVRGRKQFSLKAEAESFRIDLETKLRQGLSTVSMRSPFDDVAEDYLRQCALRVKNDSMTNHNYVVYEGHIKNYIYPDPGRHDKGRLPSRMKVITEGMGHLPTGEIIRSDVTKFRDILLEAGVSVQTTRKILGTLRQICAFSIEKGLMVSNPVDNVRVTGRRDEGYRKVVIPARESVRRVIDRACPEMRMRLRFAAATGARAGELHALTWRQVDVVRGLVTIDRRVDAYGTIEVTKTAAGMRDIPIDEDLIEELAVWQERAGRPPPECLVFPDTDGSILRHDVMIKRWYNPIFKLMEKEYKSEHAGKSLLVKRFRWHDLRHFAISCWIAAGIPPKAVQTFAGHSSLQVTMDRYGHLFPDDRHREAINTAFKALRL